MNSNKSFYKDQITHLKIIIFLSNIFAIDQSVDISLNKKFKNLIRSKNYNLNFPKEFLKFLILKNKIANYFDSKSTLFEFYPSLKDDIEFIKKVNVLRSMNLYNHILKICNLLERNNIDALILKGIGLSQIIHKSFFKRESEDIDLLIDFETLEETLTLLKNINYFIKEPERIESNWKSYCTFVLPEIKLVNSNRNFPDIDLHWRASQLRRKDFEFNKLWSNRQIIKKNDSRFFTLSNKDAFHHFCCHSSVDNWHLLRDFFDIEKFMRILPKNDIDKIINDRSVIRSIKYTNVLIKNSKRENQQKFKIFMLNKKKVILRSWMTKPTKNPYLYDWNLIDRIFNELRLLQYVNNIKNFFEILFKFFVPPSYIRNLETNKNRNIFEIFQELLKNFFNRIAK